MANSSNRSSAVLVVPGRSEVRVGAGMAVGSLLDVQPDGPATCRTAPPATLDPLSDGAFGAAADGVVGHRRRPGRDVRVARRLSGQS